ncbi:hypothetical protein Ancab_035005 [Ancistrocladus abbreviatus]
MKIELLSEWTEQRMECISEKDAAVIANGRAPSNVKAKNRAFSYYMIPPNETSFPSGHSLKVIIRLKAEERAFAGGCECASEHSRVTLGGSKTVSSFSPLNTTGIIRIATANKPMNGADRAEHGGLDCGRRGLPMPAKVAFTSYFNIIGSFVNQKFDHQAVVDVASKWVMIRSIEPRHSAAPIMFSLVNVHRKVQI